ncbi:MAG: hypothetical protein WC497_05075 [Patescibacteria group bacterium]
MSTMSEIAASAAAVLKTAPAKIWVRFYAGPPKGSSIRIVQRDDAAVEARQRAEAEAQRIDPDRLQRLGDKPDSGRQILRDCQQVTPGMLVSDFANAGYRLVDAFCNETRRTDGPGMKSVVTLLFALEGDAITLSPVDQDWVARRMSATYDHLSIFANPKRDGVDGPFTYRLDTLNYRGMLDGQKPRNVTRMLVAGHYSHE